MPDTQARHEILRAALRKVPVCENIDLQYLAEHSRGLSGADLKEICQRVRAVPACSAGALCRRTLPLESNV